MSRLRWGDAEDDDDVLPESTSVGPNDKGIITKTEYFKNAKGDPMKRVTKIQLAKVQTKVYEITAERRQWEKFGLAATAGNQGVTGQHGDQIMFERTNLPKKEEKKDAASAAKVHMEGRSLMEVIEEKKRMRELARAKGLIVDGPPTGPGGDGLDGGGPTKRDGVYVPPTRKPGMAGAYDGGRGDRPPDYSLRVSNLSETVSEGDLRALFGKFGDISRACVVYDRETGEHRGFAFVNFRLKSCAEKAIEFLDGYGYENMILRVEMAAPREQR